MSIIFNINKRAIWLKINLVLDQKEWSKSWTPSALRLACFIISFLIELFASFCFGTRFDSNKFFWLIFFPTMILNSSFNHWNIRNKREKKKLQFPFLCLFDLYFWSEFEYQFSNHIKINLFQSVLFNNLCKRINQSESNRSRNWFCAGLQENFDYWNDYRKLSLIFMRMLKRE